MLGVCIASSSKAGRPARWRWGEGAASPVLLSGAMLTPGWSSAFAFPCINAGIRLEDVDVFLMHLRLKPEYIISLLHVDFTHIQSYRNSDLCSRIIYAEAWDPVAQWATILVFHSYLFAWQRLQMINRARCGQGEPTAEIRPRFQKPPRH